MFEFFLGALTPLNLLWMVIGSTVGAIIGFLPGIGPTTGIVLFMPITFNLPAETALIALVSIYTCGSFAGNITAVLFNTPGTSDSLFMCFDGYPMTVQGKGARALGITTIASFVGGIVGCLSLLFIAPPLAQLAIKFGPLEMFLTTMLGVAIIISLSKDNMLKGFISALLGFLCALIGADKLTALPRLDFGFVGLYDGLPLLPVILGVFGLSQMFMLVMSESKSITMDNLSSAVGSTWIPFKDMIKKAGVVAYSSIIGTIVGIIPAAGSTVACGLSYEISKMLDKNPETFGKGNENGLAAVSAANNAVVGGSLVPLITLAIPGNGTSAVFLGGLLIHGLVPGMDLFTVHKAITYKVIFGMILSQFFILITGLWGGKYLAKLTRVPNTVLVPIIGVLLAIGSYSWRNMDFDLYLMLIFGIIGLLMVITKTPLGPFVLSFVLGAIAETQFRRSLLLLQADLFRVLLRPTNIILLFCVIFILVFPFFPDIKKALNKKQKTV